MVVTVELKPEVQASLLAEAQAKGLSLQEYLEELIQDHASSMPSVLAEEWEKELDEFVSSFPDSPALSDEAISRESMYPDRW